MTQFIKQFGKLELSVFTVFFVFLLFFNFGVPLIDDAWINSGMYLKKGGFLNWLLFCDFWYKNVNGRFSSLVVTGFFEQSQFLLDLANTFLFSAIAIIIFKLSSGPSKNKFILALLSTVPFLWVSDGVRMEVYFYAQMFYLFPVFTILLFAYLIQKSQLNEQGLSQHEKYLLYVLAFLSSNWVEHISFGFTFSLIFFSILYYIQHRGLPSFLKKAIAFSIVAFYYLISSPGLKESRTIIDKEKSLVDVVKLNALDTFSRVVLSNGVLVGLTSIGLCILIVHQRKSISIRFFRYLLLITSFVSAIFMNLGLIYASVTTIQGTDAAFSHFPIAVLKNFSKIRNQWDPDVSSFSYIEVLTSLMSPGEIGIVWFVSLNFLIALMTPFFLQNRINKSYLFIYLVGIFSLAPMMVTPNIGYRISSIGIFMIIALGAMVWSMIEVKRVRFVRLLGGSLLLLAFIGGDYYATIFYRINNVQSERNSLINDAVLSQRKGEWDYTHVLTLPRFSPTDLWHASSPDRGTFHFKPFLEYHNLNLETLVAFNNTKDTLKVEFQGNQIVLTVNPVIKKNYKFSFVILKNGAYPPFKEIPAQDSPIFKIDTFKEPALYTFESFLEEPSMPKINVRAAQTLVIKE